MITTVDEAMAEVERRKQTFSRNPSEQNAIKMLSAEILLLGFVCRGLSERIETLEGKR